MPADASGNQGRLLAIGDIHGCDVALETLLHELAPGADDTVVVLGDVIDRGPDTRRCIDILLDLQKSSQLVSILGNHEEMFLDALAGGSWSTTWLQSGGAEMLESYDDSIENIPTEHLDYIHSMRDYFESEWDLFVHATPHFDIPISEQPPEFLRWNRLTGREPPQSSGKRVICGHTAQRSGVPLVFFGWVCLDSNAYGPHGALSGLDVHADVIYQAEQSGTYRGQFPLSVFEARPGRR
jgi:serine/threonine protein phosphatase 1